MIVKEEVVEAEKGTEMRAFLAAVVLLFCISKLNLLMFSMFYSLQGNQCLFIVVRRLLKISASIFWLRG